MQAGRAILVVDDEELICGVAQAILRGRGYKVLTAKDSDAAAEAMRENGHEVCLILLDACMPGMDPQKLVPALLAENPHALILVSSGSLPAEALLRFHRGSVAGFVQKPYTAARLRDAVGLALLSCRAAA